MSKAIINFSTEELKQLLENKDSCVTVRNSVYSLALYPYHLSDCNSSVKELLNLSIGKYEKKLGGILLGYKNIKLLSSDGTIVSDSCHIHLDIQADFYIFKPEVGCNLIGIVNKKSDDHVGCLVHNLFNISIPKPENDDEWVGHFTEIGQEIIVNVTYIDLESRLPYIRAKIDLDHFQVPEPKNDKSTINELNDELQKDDTDNISPSKKKKHKNNINQSLNESNENNEDKKSKKKKERKSKTEHELTIGNDNNETSLDDNTKKSMKKEKNLKKKRHSKLDITEYEHNNSNIKEEEITLISKEKSKHKLNNSRLELNTVMADQEDRKSKKKRNSSINGTLSIDGINLQLHDSDLDKLLSDSNTKHETSITEENSSHKKNKKNKSIDNSLIEEDSSHKKNKKNKSIDNNLIEETPHKKNKKHKSTDDSFTEEHRSLKRKRKRNLSEAFDEISDSFESKKHKLDLETTEEVPAKKHESKRKSKDKLDS